MSTNLQGIILAAGKSKRFNTGKTKLLEKICGQEMILYLTKILQSMHIPTTMVVGYQKEAVQEVIVEKHGNTINFVTQQEQFGTGHAIMCARDIWQEEHILITNGDMPLVTVAIIEKLFKKHRETEAVISFVIAHNADPSLLEYDRVVQSDHGIKIIETSNCTDDEVEHCCVNAGIYIVTKSFLEQYIDVVGGGNSKHEFYLADLVNSASDMKLKITTVLASFDLIRGVNTFQELWAAEQIKRAELIKNWMQSGVRFASAQSVHIDLDVTIGMGSYIGSGVHLLNGSRIGINCTIGEFSLLSKVSIADNVHIKSHCVVKNSIVEEGAMVGPFAHVHGDTILKADTVIGNFVEIKKSIIGQGTKAKHLTYLGQTHIGANVNIGAGTITCNYDGKQKYKTIIEDNVFIGSNNTIVAPMTIYENAFTAAGSTLTQNVPAHALAIARTRQVNKIGYRQDQQGHNNEHDIKKIEMDLEQKELAAKNDDEPFFIGAISTDFDFTNLE